MTGLKTFFNYYGGKWRAAPKYPAPNHRTIIEPFAGAAGYSLRYPDREVILYDKDPAIIGIWQYLIRATPAEIRDLPLLDPGQSVDDLPVPQGAKDLIGFLCNAGPSSPRKTLSKWAREKPGMSFWGPARRERTAQQVSHIKQWRAILGGYEDIALDLTATWFVDPPYQKAGKHYRHGSGAINFEHLGHWCRERKGQVIVCENAGADWLPFVPFADIQATPGRSRAGVSKEVVYIQ